jgi:hypothetical protein
MRLLFLSPNVGESGEYKSYFQEFYALGIKVLPVAPQDGKTFL